MQRLSVSVSAATDNVLVAAIAGRRVRVLGYHLVSAGSVVATWKGGLTAISGAMTFAAGQPQTAMPATTYDAVAIMQTDQGEALNLTLASAVRVSGWLVFDYVN